MLCLSIDGLQAGMLGPYGNTWIHTPQFNRLAANAWLADQCLVTQPDINAVLSALWTDPLLHARRWTLLTDDPVAYDHAQAQKFSERFLMDLPAQVASSAGDLANTQLAALFGKAAEILPLANDANGLWIHTRGMFGPWDAPVELRNQYADEEDPTPPELTVPPEQWLPEDYEPDLLLGITHAYAGQVSLLDTCLGILLNALDEHLQKEQCPLALVGVRGFPLGEHLRIGSCDAALYRELVHVPLMIFRPGPSTTAGRSALLHTHDDVPAMLLGQPPGDPERDHLIFQSHTDRAIRTPAWYLRESGAPDHLRRELYVKPDDLWEVNDVADRCADIVTGLAEALHSQHPIPIRLADPLVASAWE